MMLNHLKKEQEFYQNTVRVLLILFFFSDSYENEEEPNLAKVLHSEVKIQKIDFLIRYPSYLCDELMNIAERDKNQENAIGDLVSTILNNNEPKLKTKEMQRFFFGAYDKLDEIIAFLYAKGLVKFRSKRRSDLRQHTKEYFLTKFGVEKIENGLKFLPTLQWYFDRCQVIKTYFGDLSGTELKAMQYEHPEYRKANWRDVIKDIENRVRKRFINKFAQEI